MSTAISGLFGAMQGTFGARAMTTTRILTSGTIRSNPYATYALMRDFASGNNPYRDWSTIMTDYGLENVAIQPLRTPVNAVCRVYKNNLWPGTIREDDEQSALPLELRSVGTEEKLRAAVHQVWRWSNLNDQKDQSAYDAAMLGDQLFKIRSDRDTNRSWFELVQPDYMTDLDIDGRGYLTYIRLDVPQDRILPDGKRDPYMHTEVWDKRNKSYRRWERPLNGPTALDQLGTPLDDENMEEVFGVDFVPFVHWKIDTTSNDFRGVPVCMPAIDKIVFGDLLATKLHQRLAREMDWALEGVGLDPEGLPFGAPSMTNDGGESVQFGTGKIWAFPSGWRLRSLIADMPYAEHRAELDGFYARLAETDLPELAWGRVLEAGTQSGIARRYQLINAISRIEQARGRAESSLIRATQMCLSVAQQLDAPGFSEREIGTYSMGDFDFWIADRPIVPLSEVELSEIETQRVARVQTMTNAGAGLDAAMMLSGYSDDDIERATTFTSGIER